MDILYINQYINVNNCDTPRPWGLYFQDSATPQMEGLQSNVLCLNNKINKKYIYNKQLSNKYMFKYNSTLVKRTFRVRQTTGYALYTKSLYKQGKENIKAITIPVILDLLCSILDSIYTGTIEFFHSISIKKIYLKIKGSIFFLFFS
jgi:hypothetical protein